MANGAAETPKALLWMHQLKREHKYLADRLTHAEARVDECHQNIESRTLDQSSDISQRLDRLQTQLNKIEDSQRRLEAAQARAEKESIDRFDRVDTGLDTLTQVLTRTEARQDSQSRDLSALGAKTTSDLLLVDAGLRAITEPLQGIQKKLDEFAALARGTSLPVLHQGREPDKGKKTTGEAQQRLVTVIEPETHSPRSIDQSPERRLLRFSPPQRRFQEDAVQESDGRKSSKRLRGHDPSFGLLEAAQKPSQKRKKPTDEGHKILTRKTEEKEGHDACHHKVHAAGYQSPVLTERRKLNG